MHVLAKYSWCVISRDTEVANERWKTSIQFKYILSSRFSTILFAGCSFLFFFSNRLQRLYAVLISPPSDISGTPCHPVLHSIENPRFYLYLISNKFMMICEGSGDVHPLIYRCFTSVKQMASLVPLPLYPRERSHGTH